MSGGADDAQRLRSRERAGPADTAGRKSVESVGESRQKRRQS